jgi:L-ascorbate metabolism protein UlaG (beta-lactamase superfamily)
MKRREIIRYTTAGVLSAIVTTLTAEWEQTQAQTTSPKLSPSPTTKPSVSPSPNPNSNDLSVQWLGHTCFLFTGGGFRVLVNPFRRIGCTTGYRDVTTSNPDLILISSRLLDEGVIDGFKGNPGLLYEPGVYKFNDLRLEGIRTEKDREKGRRFGTNVTWLWKQAGIKIFHLGALTSPIGIEQQILVGRPDLLLLPVGGGVKAYTPQEAAKVVQVLKPKIVIPTHYKTKAADEKTCDLVGIDEFLGLMSAMTIRNVNSDTFSLKPSDLPDQGSVIEVLSYKFS